MMTPYEKAILIIRYEKFRASFIKAVNDAGGNGEALWESLDSFTTQGLMIHLCCNSIIFSYCPENT